MTAPKPETVKAMRAVRVQLPSCGAYLPLGEAAVVADRLVAEAVNETAAALNEWQIGSWLDELADILKIEVRLPDSRVVAGIEQPVTPADVLAFIRTGVAEAVAEVEMRYQVGDGYEVGHEHGRLAERKRLRERVEWVLSHYPEDVFLPGSDSPDARAGAGARVALREVLRQIDPEGGQ